MRCGFEAMDFEARKKEAPAVPGLRVATSDSDRKDQNVMLQLLSVPVSPDALSFTRRFLVPFYGSVDRFTLKVWMMLSVLPPVRLCST